MAFDSHKNFAYSLIAIAPSPSTSGTSITVTSGQGALFPTPPFNATVWPTASIPITTNSEIVRVTNIAGDVLTITRAQESTTARAIIVGDQIANTITAKVITDLETLTFPSALVNTRANILATSAATVQLAIANDALPGEPNVYLADGTAWRQTPIRWGTITGTIDIGAIKYSNDAGYGELDVTSKILHTVAIGGFNESLFPAQTGALRVSSGAIQGYQNGAWKNFRLLSQAEIDDIMLYSQLTLKKTLAANSISHTVMDAQGFVDIGVYASDHIIDGGQLV